MQIELPSNVKLIIETLESAGYEAYAVGGCVRDSLLGRIPNDWDITTSAKPLETKALFKKTFDTGIKHGTVSILLGGEIYEVTTFRIDGEYEDGRHPKEVSFTGELKEDLLRRDFTINAMAYNPSKGLIDLYEGKEDLERGIIRCVGNPYDRFSEDALRIMRAVRFAAQLNYEIDNDTKKAITELAPTLSKISAERIQTELVKMMVSDHPEYIKMAYELGITKVIMPEFDDTMVCAQNNPNHIYTVGEHTIRVLEALPCDKVLRLAGLFHDFGKVVAKTTDESGVDHFKKHPIDSEKIARKIFARLKFDKDTENKVCRLVETHDWTMGANPEHIRKYINRIGEDYFPMIFELNKADLLAQSDYRIKEKQEMLDALMTAYEKVVEAGDCVSLKTLAVTGRDIIALGIPGGPRIGEIMQELLDDVLEEPSLNTKETLLKMVKEKELQCLQN